MVKGDQRPFSHKKIITKKSRISCRILRLIPNRSGTPRIVQGKGSDRTQIELGLLGLYKVKAHVDPKSSWDS